MFICITMFFLFLSDKQFYDPHTNLIVLSLQGILIVIINWRTLWDEDNA